MLKLFFLLLIPYVLCAPSNNGKNDLPQLAKDNPPLVKNRCCINSPNKPKFPNYIANYNCSQLSHLGKNRCEEIFQGDVWKLIREIL